MAPKDASFDAWIGKKEVSDERIDRWPTYALKATMGWDDLIHGGRQ